MPLTEVLILHDISSTSDGDWISEDRRCPGIRSSSSVALPRASGLEVFLVCSYFHHIINLQNLEASKEAKTAWLSHSLSTTINCGVVLKNNCDVIQKLIVALLSMHSKYHIHFHVNVYKD